MEDESEGANESEEDLGIPRKAEHNSSSLPKPCFFGYETWHGGGEWRRRGLETEEQGSFTPTMETIKDKVTRFSVQNFKITKFHGYIRQYQAEAVR